MELLRKQQSRCLSDGIFPLLGTRLPCVQNTRVCRKEMPRPPDDTLAPHRPGGSQMPFQSLVRRRPGPAPEVPTQGVKQNRAQAPGLEDSGHTDAEHPNKSDSRKSGLSFLICKMGVHAVTTTGTLTWEHAQRC